MPDSEAPERRAAVRAKANNLRIDAATAEIFTAFAGHGIEARLLKGPALSSWYADEPARSYLDCDVWVRPQDRDAAGEALASLGFSAHRYEEGLPDWWQEHAVTWSRHSDGVVVDLHRTLQGIGVDPGTGWEVLAGHTETTAVAGTPVPILAVSAKFLYVTLHAAHHGQEWAKALSHVEHGLAAVDDWVLSEATALAEALDAVDMFAAGLRLVPAGARAAEHLELPAVRSVSAALRAGTPPPVALGFEQLAEAETLRARLNILARKLVPPPAFIRHWWPGAARNRRMLVLAYLYRPVWLLRKAPEGWRSWRAARRAVRRAR